MKKKKLKIKWKNVALFGILLICGYVVIHDLFMLTIYSWITGQYVGWTWFGLGIFFIAFAVGGAIIEYFDEEINKKK